MEQRRQNADISQYLFWQTASKCRKAGRSMHQPNGTNSTASVSLHILTHSPVCQSLPIDQLQAATFETDVALNVEQTCHHQQIHVFV